MTARSNHAGGISRVYFVPILLAAIIFVIAGAPILAQTAQGQATHKGAILYVRPPVGDGGLQAPAASDANWQRAIATHVVLIPAKSRLLRAMNDPNSDALKTIWFNRFKSSAEAADWLEANLHVAQIPNTALVELWITGDINPKEAGTITEEVAALYLEDHRRQQSDQLLNRKNALDQLKAKHDTMLRQLRQETSRANGELQIVESGKSGAIAQKESELLQLIGARTKAEGDANEATSAMEAAKAALERATVPPAVQMQVSQNPRITMLKQQLDALEIEIRSQAAANTTSQYKALVDKRTATQERLEAVSAEVRSSVLATHMDELQNRLADSQRRLEALNKSIEKLRLDLMDLSFQLGSYVQKIGEMNSLAETAQRERNTLDALGNTISANDQSDIVWMEHPQRGP